jgi:6-phosphogluconolactonase
MKFQKFGQIVLASAVTLGLAGGLTACSSRTIDFVYVTSAKNTPGQLNVFEVDSQSGAIHAITGSPFPQKYNNPVGLVVSPNSQYLYVAYRDSNVIQQYSISTTGQLSAGNTYSTPGTLPQALAINTAGTYLYVVDTYQPGFSASTPGPGALVVYPINSDGSLGTALTNGKNQFYAVGMTPSAVNVLYNNSAVFVTARTSDSTSGLINAFTVGSGGALTAMGSGDSGLGAGAYAAGVQPSAVASDITSSYIYVTDFKQNQLLAYRMQSGGLAALQSSPFKTGDQPINLTIDPRNKYLYVTNFTSQTLSGYQIDMVTGNLTALAGGINAASTGPEPTCVFIEPALARFVYTTNFLDNSISGFKLDPNSGALSVNQGSPVPAAAGPNCGVAIAHGNHATQHVDGVN